MAASSDLGLLPACHSGVRRGPSQDVTHIGARRSDTASSSRESSGSLVEERGIPECFWVAEEGRATEEGAPDHSIALTGGPWAPRAPLGPVTPVGPYEEKGTMRAVPRIRAALLWPSLESPGPSLSQAHWAPSPDSSGSREHLPEAPVLQRDPEGQGRQHHLFVQLLLALPWHQAGRQHPGTHRHTEAGNRASQAFWGHQVKNRQAHACMQACAATCVHVCLCGQGYVRVWACSGPQAGLAS